MPEARAEPTKSGVFQLKQSVEFLSEPSENARLGRIDTADAHAKIGGDVGGFVAFDGGLNEGGPSSFLEFRF